MRFTYVATFITILLYAMVTWGTTGDTTVVGPTFSFGNISTSNNKVRATRPSDRVIFAGSNGATVEASGKTVTFFSPVVGGVVGFRAYSSGVASRFRSTFLTQTANPNLPNSQAMGALSTGIVKNTTTTGVQSIAIASDFPTLNQDTSGTAANLSGTPALPNGTTATTQAAGDNSTKLATDAYVDTGLATKVPYTGATAALDMGAYNISTTGNVKAGNASSANTVLSATYGTTPNAARLNIGYNATSVNYFDGNTQIFRNGAFAEKFRLSGNALLVNTTTDDTINYVQVNGGITATNVSPSGNLSFTGTGNRITGDFSNATAASRVAVQTSTTNGNTLVNVLPNGTATTTRILAFNNSDSANSAQVGLVALTTSVGVRSLNSGTGTLLPLAFFLNSTEYGRLNTTGNWILGATTETAGAEKLQVTGAISASGAVLVGGGANTVYYCDAGASVGNMCRGNGCSCVGGAWIATSLKID